MVRELTAGDTADACALLRARPIHNVFLDYVVSSGVLGRTRGFYGFAPHGRLEAVMMIGPLGSTTLEARDRSAFAPLAQAAQRAPMRPRHIVGSEDVTQPFWEAYASGAGPVIWERREPYYLVRSGDALPRLDPPPARIERATERDLEVTLGNSALQHREDLAEDRCAVDPDGFRRRHLKDLRDGRWWVLREAGRIVFQAHVGADNAHVVQIGGVVTVPDARRRGHATRGMAAITGRLLKWRPAVGLFCNERNMLARGVYERVGFRRVFDYHSWLLDEPLAPTPSGRYA